MTTRLATHPSHAQLRSFSHGRLAAAEMAEVESHVAQCDECCRVLEAVPEDTLVHLAREAATQAFRAGEPSPSPAASQSSAIPPELAEHQRYRILGLLGTGGMGAVYKAEHRLMERIVALKTISRAFTANDGAVERFQREVKAAAKLSHPNIVTAHDAEQAGDLHFLVMEYVEGVSLDRLIARQGLTTVPQACNMIRHAALGLQHAHEKGMVHRDIKPQNLMVTRKGQVKILDFGLARLAQEKLLADCDVQEGAATDGVDSPGKTTAGMILGTPDYIAPEQAQDSRSADIRADIYSLGCTLYYLLTGSPPFPTGNAMQKLSSHLHATPLSVIERRQEVPSEVAAIVEKMMAKNPQDRYQTPAEVAKDLSAVQKGTATSATPKGDEAPKPMDDFLAGFDMAAATPLLPAHSKLKTQQQFSPLELLSRYRQPLLVAGGMLAGVLLLCLGIWGAMKLASDERIAKAFQKSEKPAAKAVTPSVVPGQQSKGTPNGANTVSQVPGTTKSADTPPPPPPRRGPSGGPGEGRAGFAPPPKRILVCAPHTGMHYADYWNVAWNLPPHVEVLVASTESGTCVADEYGLAGGKSVAASYVLGKDEIDVRHFDALLFTGKITTDFTTGSVSAATGKLIQQFQAEDKLICSICKGQDVLAHHGVLGAGVKAVRSPFLDERYSNCGAEWDYNSPVIQDGRIITAKDENAGQRLAKDLMIEFLKD